MPGVPPNPDLETHLTIEQEGDTLESTIAIFSKSNPSKTLTSPLKDTYVIDGAERKNSDGSASKISWD